MQLCRPGSYTPSALAGENPAQQQEAKPICYAPLKVTFVPSSGMHALYMEKHAKFQIVFQQQQIQQKITSTSYFM
jgi:hypothetical protein